jgi:hypothetical protein
MRIGLLLQAIASQIPVPAPVTIATLPSNLLFTLSPPTNRTLFSPTLVELRGLFLCLELGFPPLSSVGLSQRKTSVNVQELMKTEFVGNMSGGGYDIHSK